MEDFDHLDICWTGNTIIKVTLEVSRGHYLWFANANTRGANHRNTLLDLLLNEEEIVVNVITDVSLVCNHCEKTEIEIWKKAEKVSHELGLQTSGHQILAYLENCWVNPLGISYKGHYK